jgi:hypothetical protein
MEQLPPPRCLIIATMRDEGPYLLEWLAYHKAIGVTDFLVFSNDCRDGTDLLLDRLQANGELTHVRTTVLKRGPQKSAYKEALQHEKYLQADWVFPCDVDEFLNVKMGAGTVQDLIARYRDADAIPVCWRMYSNQGIEGFIDGFTTDALTDAEPETGPPDGKGHFVKSIFRPHPEITRIGFHTPIYSDGFEAEVKWGAPWITAGKSENPRRPEDNFGYSDAQINHYAVRTVASYMLKRDRGDGASRVGRFEIDYWQRWCRGGIEDASIQRHNEKLLAEFERLTSDPVVQGLFDGAKAWHAQRHAELVQEDEFAALKAEILALGPAQDTAPASAPEIKAPKRHLNRLRMLESMPKNARCAEIGVWNGVFSSSILEVTTPQELVLIDPWDLLSNQSADEKTHKLHSDSCEMQEMYQRVQSRYGTARNVKIRKGFSADVLESFPDDYFDWVYIDGNHLYDFVRKDLELSFRKVRPGGVIAGDDFFWKRDGRMHVREAVLDVMRSHGMSNRPTRMGQQYMISVP